MMGLAIMAVHKFVWHETSKVMHMCENSFSCDCVMIISINEMNSRIQVVNCTFYFFCLVLVSLTSDMW